MMMLRRASLLFDNECVTGSKNCLEGQLNGNERGSSSITDDVSLSFVNAEMSGWAAEIR